MHIDWWTLALQSINLLVLVWLLGRFLFRPLARIVDERRAAVDKAIEDAKTMRDQAEKARAEAADASARIEAKRARLLDEAAEDAAKEKARLIEEARKDADHKIEEARQEIERQRAAEAEQTVHRAARLAVDIAARLLDRLPAEARLAGFPQALGEALASLPADKRDEIIADGSAVTLLAAAEPSKAQMHDCRAAIAEAFGREIAVTCTVRPELIAGVELEAPGLAVRNSLRSGLDRIAEQLAAPGPADG